MTINDTRLRRQILMIGVPALLFFSLSCLITLNTLSLVVSRSFPERALWFNKHNTAALAQSVSEEVGREARRQIDVGPTHPQNNGMLADLSASTRRLSEVLKSEPFNASSLRLLGQVAFASGALDRGTSLQSKASDLSSHEILAHDFMFKTSVDTKNYASAMLYGDRMFSAAPNLLSNNASTIELLITNAASRDELKTSLISASWRPHFFTSVLPKLSLPGLVAASDLVASLPSSQLGKLTILEQNALLNSLVAKQQLDTAYALWLRFLPSDRSEFVDLLSNGSFDSDPSGAPFDWNIFGGREATAKIGFVSGSSRDRGLHLEFGNGRVILPNVYQYILLAPGHYMFQASFKGELTGRRGLQWVVNCIDDRRVGESAPILGKNYRWQKMGYEFDIPDNGCSAQRVTLIHNARSPSEQLIFGSIWFEKLSIIRGDQSGAIQASKP